MRVRAQYYLKVVRYNNISNYTNIGLQQFITICSASDQ